MASRSDIEWTDATWNPSVGCDKVSSGCLNCYAERFSERWRGIKGHHFEFGFDLTMYLDRVKLPMKWRKPKKIFVNSMSDLFHRDIPGDFIESVFKTMKKCPQHTFQILTKRSARACNYRDTLPWGNNVWMGTSIESKHFLHRADDIRNIPAGRRFLSLEPLLEDLGQINLKNIEWVIVGGESGPGARPIDAAWVRNIRDQCIDSKVAFFFKQWGGVNKKKAGRLLDGRYWNQFPEVKKDDRRTVSKENNTREKGRINNIAEDTPYAGRLGRGSNL